MILVIVVIFLLFVGYIFLAPSHNESSRPNSSFQEKANISQRLFQEGVCLFENKMFSSALDKFNEAIRERPASLYSSAEYNYQVKCYLELEQYEKVLGHQSASLYQKAIAAFKLGDHKKAKSLIIEGRYSEYDRYEELKDELFSLSTDLNHFLHFLTEDDMFQLIRNVEEEDLIEPNQDIIALLNKIKSAMNSPNSLNPEGGFLIRTLTSSDVKKVFKKIDLVKLLSKVYLYLNIESRTGKKNNYVNNNRKTLHDLTFLKYFRSLTALNLMGHKSLNNYNVIGKLEFLEELNISGTNITDLSFLDHNSKLNTLHLSGSNQQLKEEAVTRKPGIKIITDGTSNLKEFSPYSSVNRLRNELEQEKININNLSEYIQQRDGLSYPKIFLPYEFRSDPANFNSKKVLSPQFDYHIPALKGKSEALFFRHLKEEFGYSVFDNAYLEHAFGYLPKFPDFLLSCEPIINKKQYQFHIDVEIDEPYTIGSQIATHLVGDDVERNSIFLGENWFIIRFAEEQIIKYPEKCCILISNFKKHIEFCLHSGYAEFQDRTVPKIPAWRQEDVIEMKKQQYRVSYLNVG
jgi:hypothetical protein